MLKSFVKEKQEKSIIKTVLSRFEGLNEREIEIYEDKFIIRINRETSIRSNWFWDWSWGSAFSGEVPGQRYYRPNQYSISLKALDFDIKKFQQKPNLKIRLFRKNFFNGPYAFEANNQFVEKRINNEVDLYFRVISNDPDKLNNLFSEEIIQNLINLRKSIGVIYLSYGYDFECEFSSLPIRKEKFLEEIDFSKKCYTRMLNLTNISH